MVPISLQGEFQNYMRACYGDRELPAQQRREVEQAFLSGIHVLNELVADRGDGYGTDWLHQALADRLRTLGSLPCP
jgi:hypothetical protein